MAGISSGSGGADGATDRAAAAASDVAEQGGRKAAETVQQAGQRAGETVSSARQNAEQRVNDGMTMAGERVGHLATALRRSGASLEEEGDGGAAQGAHQLADRIEQVSTYLTDGTPDRLLRDTSEQVRRHPWMFAAGGLVLGMAAARVVRTAAETAIAQNGTSSSGPSTPSPELIGERPITGPAEGQVAQPYAAAAVSGDD